MDTTGGLGPLDYTVLAICLAAMAVVGAWGVWGGRRGATTEEFFFAGRRLRWWPLGLSLATAGLTAVVCCGAPNEAYWVGTRLLWVPLLTWAALPLVFRCVIPLCANLDIDSIYEYLELRFDAPTRLVAAATYVVWQVLWLGGLLALPGSVLKLGGGLNVLTAALMAAVAGVATVYTFFGGMRATVRTDVVQLALVAVGLLVVIAAVVANLEGGLPEIWEVAERLGRTSMVGPMPDWLAQWSDRPDYWSPWAVVPYLVLVPMCFFVADQATVQRLLAARDTRDMKRCCLLAFGVSTGIALLAIYVGLGLLAVYHNNAQAEIPPNWVVHSASDPETGRPLIGPQTVIDAESIGPLVADGWVLDPNTNRPLRSAEGLVDARGRVIIDRLATRATREGGGERRLRVGGDELFGRFVKRHLRFGAAGLVLAALAAAVMAAIDSAINALATVVVTDFHRRFGWAERWLARRCGKQPEDLDQADEYHLGRPIVLIFGGVIIVVSLVVAGMGSVFGFLLGVLGLFAGPLLGVFLLGWFTRRATGPAVLAALAFGVLAAAWATLGNHLAGWADLSSADLGWAWPFEKPPGPLWALPLGLGATLVCGYLLSFVVGRRKSKDELRGLVVGLGELGILPEIEGKSKGAPAEEVYWIEIDDEEQS